MVCPNCGFNINQGDLFCKSCGSRINYAQINQNDYRLVNNEDIDLINAYIGPNANKLVNGGFSFCIFFFGAFYAFYRKMWLLGIGWILTNIIVNIFLPTFSTLIRFIIGIIIAIKFKEWYLDNAKNMVANIKKDNIDKSRDELLMICQLKGGTSLIPVVILILLYTAVFSLLFKFIISNTVIR